MEGFEVPRECFYSGITFVAFTDNTITPTDALNMLINVIDKTGTFQAKYKEWNGLPESKHTPANTFKWLDKKRRTRNKFSKLSGNMDSGHQYIMSET